MINGDKSPEMEDRDTYPLPHNAYGKKLELGGGEERGPSSSTESGSGFVCTV